MSDVKEQLPSIRRSRVPWLGLSFLVLLLIAAGLYFRTSTWHESQAPLPPSVVCNSSDYFMLGVDLIADPSRQHPEDVLPIVQSAVPSLARGEYQAHIIDSDHATLFHTDDGEVDSIVRAIRLPDAGWMVDGVEGCGS